MPTTEPAYRPCGEPTAEQREWLCARLEALPVKIDARSPSEWAERKRYLPESVTPLPGFFRFDVVPYMREIVDCLGVDSPVREVAVMKGVQIAATTAILENALGYFIDEVKTAPVMWVTADAAMAKTRLEVNILPMLQHSELDHLIRSHDVTNARKTGRTDKKLEWFGGGCLMPLGAQNPNKFRQQPAMVLLLDEVDGWPLTVKNEGDPAGLVYARTRAYEAVRKIAALSTPTIQGQSKIEELFRQGDQRRYFVCCLSCGHPQTLRWERINPETGVKTGVVWDMDGARLVPGSVRYLCEKCGHPHTNDDKTKLISPEYGAEWRATAQPAHPDFRSYHIPALLSPAGMQSWESCVLQYMRGWDVAQNRAKDLSQYQIFYNEILGEPWQQLGSRVRFVQVSEHRRAIYRFGQVPNKWAADHCRSPVLLVTCAVDVHKDNLAVAVFGWTWGARAILLNYWRLNGNTEQLTGNDAKPGEPNPWERLQKIIEQTEYDGDDGKHYKIALTLVDSGYQAEQVYRFCAPYRGGVYPMWGDTSPKKNAIIKEFGEAKTPAGRRAFWVNVNYYKDRWSGALRWHWDGHGHMPESHFNAPLDVTDDQLKELTRETKHERTDARTGRRIGWEWRRASGSRNELWDLLVYNTAAVEILACDICQNQLKLDAIHWPTFWKLLLDRKVFYR